MRGFSAHINVSQYRSEFGWIVVFIVLLDALLPLDALLFCVL
jgi:hypothetical protein